MAASESYLPLGSITGAHGVRGNVKLYPYDSEPPDLVRGTRLQMEDPLSGRRTTCTVRWCKRHGRIFLLACEEITTREQARAVAGHTLLINRINLPALGTDTYYWNDLIGLRVYAGGGRFLGHLTQIIPTGANDVYVVGHPESGEEVLIPAVKSVIQEVDSAAGIMRVDLPETAE
ncbi:MAG: ribosome maturation factor RimM [Desulfosudaceae bacterium]